MARKKTRVSKRSAPARSGARKKHIRRASRPLSPERKKDILGVALLISCIVALLGFLGIGQSSLTVWMVQVLGWIAGMGALLFPLVLGVIGLWLILRNEQRLPMPSWERMLGIIFLYVNALAWLHWLNGGGWDLAARGGGGGYVGGIFERLLVIGLGEWGALVVLVAWLLVALAFTFDLSIPDLFRNLSRPAVKTGAFVAEQSAKLKQATAVEKKKIGQADQIANFPRSATQLEGFRPIRKRGDIWPKSSGKQLTEKQPVSLSPRSGTDGRRISRAFRSTANGLDWKLPEPEKILNPASPAVIKKSFDQDRAHVIEETLASFGAPSHVVEIHHGPTITQYGIEPDFIQTRTGKMRVRVSKITALADDLALALAAPSIRIQAPVPGRHFVGIEVPNEEAELVSLLEGMQHKAFQQSRAFLKFVLGKDVSGKPVFIDLISLPHLLIAGTTGAGKSVCLHSILRCLLLQRTPNELRLVLVDPKRVEMGSYNGLPHLLTPVVVEPEKVVSTLQWMSREMDSRYKKFAEVGARQIEDYNQHQPEKMPYILVVIDELADLMMMAPEETERLLNRLAQLARATGIHVIIATQRPSVDVITGMIKANFPARIALSVASNVDSRVILDQPGAERLLGRGDMLYQAPDAPTPIRLQGVYVSDDEFNRILRFWCDQARQFLQEEAQAAEKMPQKYFPSPTISTTPLFDEAPELEEDTLLNRAIEIVRQEERASISMLQRKLRIGYTRAARLIDRLEELEIIGKSDPGGGFRPVLDFGENDREK